VDRGFGDLVKMPKEALLATSYYRGNFHPIQREAAPLLHIGIFMRQVRVYTKLSFV
jgi:hypothetical protein